MVEWKKKISTSGGFSQVAILSHFYLIFSLSHIHPADDTRVILFSGKINWRLGFKLSRKKKKKTTTYTNYRTLQSYEKIQKKIRYIANSLNFHRISTCIVSLSKLKYFRTHPVYFFREFLDEELYEYHAPYVRECYIFAMIHKFFSLYYRYFYYTFVRRNF